MGGAGLDGLAAAAELGAAKDVAGADDHGQLHAALSHALHLSGQVERFIKADAALAGVAERLAAQLEDDATVFRFERIAGLFVHDGVPVRVR